MQSETIELNGHPFFIRRWGDSSLPPLLMLHGFPEYGGAWTDFAPLLAHRYQVIAPDQRGYGHSWAPDEVDSYKAHALVADMAALIAHIGSPVTLLGHDWGSAVTYALAFSHPELVTRLIIGNGIHPVPFQRACAAGGAQSEASQYINFLRRPDSHEILAANDFEKMVQFLTSKMDTSWMTPKRLAEYKAEWARGGKLKTMIHWYRASPIRVADPGKPITGLPEIPRERVMVKCPHLLLWGERDNALLPVSTEGLEEFAPDLTRVNLPDADHWLFHQQPEEIAQIILDWAS